MKKVNLGTKKRQSEVFAAFLYATQREASYGAVRERGIEMGMW